MGNEEEQIQIFSSFEQKDDTLEDSIILLSQIKNLSKQLGSEEMIRFENSISFYQSSEISYDIISYFLKSKKSKRFLNDLIDHVNRIIESNGIIELIKKLLTFNDFQNQISNSTIGNNSFFSFNFNNGNLHQNICRQIIKTRFEFTKQFTLFLKLLEHSEIKIYLNDLFFDQNSMIDSIFILEKYSNLYWLSNKQLDTNSNRNDISIGISSLSISQNNSKTILNFIFKDFELKNLYQLNIKKDSIFLKDFSNKILFYSISTILSFINFESELENQKRIVDICSTLYQNEQFSILQEFSILNIQQNPYVSHFLGLVYLHDGISYKAKKYFHKCAILLGKKKKEIKIILNYFF